MMIVISKRLQMVYRSLVCFYNRHSIKDRKSWLCCVTVMVTLYWWLGGQTPSDDTRGHEARVRDKAGHVHVYNSETSPMIFIGGHPRSGTTLIRAIMDSHPMVRCGEETRIIPRLVSMRDNWVKNPKESERLVQAGIDSSVVDPALTSFILQTMARHGEPAPVLCDKDPLNLKWGSYMAGLFPNSKWIFMMRDGRAVIHSVIQRNVSISGETKIIF